MVCPRCAAHQSDDVKFCTSCGANLQAVRDALAGKEPEAIAWNENWLAAIRTGQIAEEHKLAMERRQGITPEVKRYNEVKAGVITGSVGIALTIFLHIFMKGIAAGVDPATAEILLRIWVAGLIPFFVGLALIVNGLVISKKQAEIMERDLNRPKGLEGHTDEPNPSPRSLRPADTNEFIPTPFSVTDQTTRHLTKSEKN